MTVPNPSKIEIACKRIHSETMEVEEEESETSKRYKNESEKELVEVGSKKMKGKIQGLTFEVQEYNFSET